MTDPFGNRIGNPVRPTFASKKGSEPREIRYDELTRTSQFLDIVSPIRDAWLAVLDAAEAVREAYGREPAPGSVAAAEAATQDEIAGDWGATPVDDAQSIVWTLVVAAEGSLAAFAELLVVDRVGPYALDVQARPVVENLARALWLAEPALGRDLRVQRAQTDRIYSLAEQGRLDPSLKAHAKEREERIIATARKLGWEVLPATKRDPRRFVNRRTATRLVGDLYLDKTDHDMGQFVYRLLSATGHGTQYGLTRRLHRVTGHPTSDDLAVVSLGTDEVRLLSHAMLLGYLAFFDRWHTYLGWDDLDEFNASMRRLRELLGPVPPSA